MKGMILAAGKGTRLQPLTNSRPKALVEINGVSLLEILIRKFIRSGISDIVINTFHFGHQIEEFINHNNSFGVNIKLSKEQELLDTGGGIKQAQNLLGDEEDILIHNVDIISKLNFAELLTTHKASKGIATLAVSKRNGNRYFLFNKDNELGGWANVSTGKEKISRQNENLTKRAFSGIQLVSPKLFTHMPEENIFSLVDFYLDVCKNEKIIAFEHDINGWYDVGKIEDIEFIKQNVKL